MTVYRFVTIGKDGQRHRGQIEAVNQDQALLLLGAKDDLVLSLEQAGKRDWFKFESKRTVTPRTASEFALELSGLIKAGASLRKALEIQVDGNGAVAKLARSIQRDIEDGQSFSQALRTAGGTAEILAEFAAAGEAGAGLAELMEASGTFLAARSKAMSKISSALAYPMFILALSVTALVVIILFVAPALAPIIEQNGNGGMILWLADIGVYLNAHSTIIFLVLAALVLMFVGLMSREPMRRSLNRIVWKLPILGGIAKDLDIGQSCDVLAALLQSGRSMEVSLQFAANVSGAELAERYRSISTGIRDGQTASAAFAAEKSLPQEVRRLAMLGEQSSTFGNAIQQAGRICHDRALRRVDAIAGVLGPTMVIGLGVGVSLLMISVLGSMSSLGEVG